AAAEVAVAWTANRTVAAPSRKAAASCADRGHAVSTGGGAGGAGPGAGAGGGAAFMRGASWVVGEAPRNPLIIASAAQGENHVPPAPAQPRQAGQQPAVAAVQRRGDPARPEHAAGHRQELEPLRLDVREDAPQDAEMAVPQRLLIGCAFLAGVGEALPGPVQQ